MSSQTATVTHSKGDATTSSRLPSTTKGKEKTGEETTPFSAPTAIELYRRMPQVPEATYKAEGTFFMALYFIVRYGFLLVKDLMRLIPLHPEFEAIITQVPKLLKVDFSSLFRPRTDYAEQTEISKRRTRLMDALAVHYDGNFGLVMRALGGEYTAEWRNVTQVLRDCEPHTTPEDLEAIRRALTRGCPVAMKWEEKAENKEVFIRRGNAPGVSAENPHVAKTCNKEEQNHHTMCFSCWWC